MSFAFYSLSLPLQSPGQHTVMDHIYSITSPVELTYYTYRAVLQTPARLPKASLQTEPHRAGDARLKN